MNTFQPTNVSKRKKFRAEKMIIWVTLFAWQSTFTWRICRDFFPICVGSYFDNFFFISVYTMTLISTTMEISPFNWLVIFAFSCLFWSTNRCIEIRKSFIILFLKLFVFHNFLTINISYMCCCCGFFFSS